MEFAVDHRMPSLSAPPSRPGAGRSPRPQQPDALRDVLAELGERVKPLTLARERTLPVAAPFDQLLPEEGLVRGRVLSCRGVADTSLAFGLIADVLAGGAWAALVDVGTFGADAASEFGIPLERVVRVDSGVTEAEQPAGAGAGAGAVASWIDVMGAAVDGFDVVVTKVPAELQEARRPAAVRKLVTRVQQKGAVVIVIGESGALNCDLVFSTERTEWSGVENGAGHLRSRVITVAADGRRLPAARTVSVLVDATSGRVVCSVAPAERFSSERDPQAELLAEMAGTLGVVEGVDGIDEVGDGDHRLAG